MFASRFVLPLLAFTGLAAFASPVEIERRAGDVSSVLTIANTLQSSTASPVAQLQSLVASKQANLANVTPLVKQIVGSLNTASTSVKSVHPIQASAASQQDVANAFAPIIAEIAVILAAVENLVPGLGALLSSLGIDLALDELLLGLDIILPGVLSLVTTLLGSVASILTNLGFVLTAILLAL